MDVISPILAIFFVVGLLAGLLVLARRAGVGKPLSPGVFSKGRLFPFPVRRHSVAGERESLCILKQVVLSPSHRVHLVLVAGQNVLLCTHPQGCTVIPVGSSPLAQVQVDVQQNRATPERSVG